jgi:hypothetical protein
MLNVVVTGTGPLFTLAEAKAQLGVEHDSDDALIGTYMDAAVAAILQYCNISLVPDGEVPEAAFKVAGLMMVAQFYAARGDDLEDLKLPGPVRFLIEPYRWLRV